jgi:hypothetical protein
MTPEQRALKAKELAENPLLHEILNHAEENCISAWKMAQTAEMRERHWQTFQAISILRSELDGTVKRALRDERANPNAGK